MLVELDRLQDGFTCEPDAGAPACQSGQCCVNACDGGTSGNDELILVGGTLESVTHTFENANDGRIDLVGVGIEESVVYTGLEPIVDNLAATNRLFTFNGGAETITISDAAAVGETTIDSTLGESVTFANPTSSLTISAGTGDDRVTIASVDAAYRAALIIDGGAGTDAIELNASLTLGSGDSIGSISFIAETIHLAGNLATDGDTTNNDAGVHFALGEIGTTSAGDRVDTTFGVNGAQTAIFRPAASACNTPSKTHRYGRLTLWRNRPVFVGGVDAGCLGTGAGEDYLVARIQTDDIFADDFN